VKRSRANILLVAHGCCGSCLSAPLTYTVVKQSIVQQRLNQYKGNDNIREVTLTHLFTEAGCLPPHLTEQQVPDRKQPNVICVLPGTSDETIVVGAHFDHIDAGDGIIDNWSGASLLPSLLQSLESSPHKHTFVFVGFTGEEAGLLGSTYYVKQLSPEQVTKIEAMINLDTLGLGPTKVWVSQSDPRLVNGFTRLAQTMKIPIAGMNMNGYGVSDEESFIHDKVCALMIHSLTPETMHVLHHTADNPSAVHADDYYATYRLLAAYLNILDAELPADGHVCTATAIDPSSLRQRRPRINRLGPH
jgi:hypothetical protein